MEHRPFLKMATIKNPYLEQERQELSKSKKTDEWQVVNEQIERSTIPRENWALILGKSLSKIIAGYKAQGLNVDEVLGKILKDYPHLTEEQIRKLRIGVSSRFARRT